MDNEKLAQFIASLGRFNDYGSTVAQTKAALDSGSVEPLRNDNDDRVIFEDTVRAIEMIKEMPFDRESIITTNSQFIGDSAEQPYRPGHLRDGVYDPIRDRIHVDLWPGDDGGTISYYPPAQIEEEDIDQIVELWKNSSKNDLDAWAMFARLAKLQPFQDGNKRTALIAANHALGAFKSQNYLMPPTGRLYIRFMDGLLGFYGVGLPGALNSEKAALKEFLEIAPVRKVPMNKFEQRLDKAKAEKQTSTAPTRHYEPSKNKSR